MNGEEAEVDVGAVSTYFDDELVGDEGPAVPNGKQRLRLVGR